MSTLTHLGRRQFLAALGSASLLGALPAISLAKPEQSGTGNFKPDLELEIRATPDEVAIFPGRRTQVWRYQAKVLQGDAKAVSTLPDSYLGPVIRVHKGSKLRVHFYNDLPEPSIIHWHGLILPEAMDGHPRYVVPPGGKYLYEFEVINRAGTYWFHPHPHGMTGEQVYGGLAGLFIVTDDEERALNLPDGAQDVALVIQDRSFSRDNQLRYLSNSGGMMGMMGGMMGFAGDQIMVNGRPDFKLQAERKAYRLRLMNGSNARIYKLAWEDGTPLTVIGTDGGLLSAPITRPYVSLAPAERIELWVDFSARRPGEALTLYSQPFAGMSGGGMMGGGLGNGEAFEVLQVNVGKGAAVAGKLPMRLTAIAPPDLQQVRNADHPRTFRVTAGRMRWGLNGRVYQMDEVADDEVVKLGTSEVWEFVNEASMGMMGGMPHPMHVHAVQFRILKRSVDREAKQAWFSLGEGFVDEGWKDTVLVMPGERVQVLMRFSHYPGLFVYHCHNLEHADMGMMRNYLIKA